MFIKYFRPSCILTKQMLPFGRRCCSIHWAQNNDNNGSHCISSLCLQCTHYAITNASDDLTSVTQMKYISVAKKQINTEPTEAKNEGKKTENFSICILCSHLICIRCFPISRNAKLIKKHAVWKRDSDWEKERQTTNRTHVMLKSIVSNLHKSNPIFVVRWLLRLSR